MPWFNEAISDWRHRNWGKSRAPQSEYVRCRPVTSRTQIYVTTKAKLLRSCWFPRTQISDVNGDIRSHTERYESSVHTRTIALKPVLILSSPIRLGNRSSGFSTKIMCASLTYITFPPRPAHPVSRPSPWRDQQIYCRNSCPTHLESLHRIVCYILLCLQVYVHEISSQTPRVYGFTLKCRAYVHSHTINRDIVVRGFQARSQTWEKRL